MRPSAFAVLRLMASSNLVGRRMGMSAGFAPLRIWPTMTATLWPSPHVGPVGHETAGFDELLVWVDRRQPVLFSQLNDQLSSQCFRSSSETRIPSAPPCAREANHATILSLVYRKIEWRANKVTAHLRLKFDIKAFPSSRDRRVSSTANLVRCGTTCRNNWIRLPHCSYPQYRGRPP